MAGPATANRYLYTGREWVSEAGLYDYRNRVYSPALGRFLQNDPIRFDAGDVNLYRYVGNSPVNWGDPTGLQTPGSPVSSLNPAAIARGIKSGLLDADDLASLGMTAGAAAIAACPTDGEGEAEKEKPKGKGKAKGKGKGKGKEKGRLPGRSGCKQAEKAIAV